MTQELRKFDLFAPHFQADPFPTYAEMRRSGPVCVLEPLGAWAVSRYADVIAVLKNPQKFSSAGNVDAFHPPWLPRQPGAHSLLAMDPPEHTKLRNLVSRALGPGSITSIEPMVRAIAERLSDTLQSRGESDFVADYAVPMTAGVIGELLTLDPSLHANFKRWTDDILSVTPVPQSPEHAERVRASVAEMERYLGDVLEARRRAPGDDLVSALLQAEIDGHKLTPEELMSFIFVLVPAGFDTTSTLISKSIITLAKRPADTERLRENPALIPRFIEEMLRWDPPTHNIFRKAMPGAEVGGVKVPAGAPVTVILASANRDEAVFPDPDEFNMDRDVPKTGTGASVAFGHGVHFCVAHLLARLEARVALESLLARFKRIDLVNPTIEWSTMVFVRTPSRLPVRGVLP
ncbi:cytochrome P450 [Sorangium sp. So ce302]|uniref:cytochrome P450 n=1 Tax=Sorangium sp. So ce302 TaxID=3133297 RepID=UPI003F64781A